MRWQAGPFERPRPDVCLDGAAPVGNGRPRGRCSDRKRAVGLGASRSASDTAAGAAADQEEAGALAPRPQVAGLERLGGAGPRRAAYNLRRIAASGRSARTPTA